MTIERRYHPRTPCDFDIQLVYRRRKFSVHAKDVSSHGMGITQDYLTIPPGTLVELEFSLGQDTWLISGLVIHAKHHHMGIMFRIPQPELAMSVRGHFPEIEPQRPPQTPRVEIAGTAFRRHNRIR